MKILKVYTICLVSLLGVFGACSDMNDLHEKFMTEGETIYAAKVDSVISCAGNNRILLKSFVGTQRVEKVRIFWNDYKDSVDLAIGGQTGKFEKQLNEIAEKSYIFQFVSIDQAGHKSLPFEVVGNVYGERYQSSLIDRSISSLSPLQQGQMTINWSGAVDDGIRCDVVYTNTSGLQVSRKIPITENTTEFTDMTSDVKYRTVFLPEETAIDTFYTDWVKLEPITISSYSDLKLGGWDSNYGSCLDVDTGTPYGSSALRDDARRPLIDVFFDEAKLACTDLDSIYYNNVSRLPDTGTRFAPTTFTAADFDGMKGDDLFANMNATQKEIAIQVGSVVFFRAKSGRKGLLKVVSMTDPKGDLTLDLKIQY